MDNKESIKGDKEVIQKYDKDNPYYKSEESFVTKLNDEEINHPTQEEIIAHNRKENQNKEQESTTVLVEKDFLEKLKDFEYWKEWKNQ